MTAKKNNSTTQTEEQVFIISRVFEAPRELVWKALTDPERMKHWWGPKGFTVQVAKMDFRPRGSYHYCLRSPEGKDMWGKFFYREIREPDQIVFVNSFSDEKGRLTRHPMHQNWPLEMLSTFTFTENKGKTTLNIEWTPLNPTEEERKAFEDGMDGMKQGWTGTLDQLTDYLKSEPFAIERTINAPIDKVWQAITDKDQMKKWYFDLPEFKPQEGFEFQFSAGKDEKKYLHLCKITEVVIGRKITYSWRYDGYQGNSFVTFELAVEGNKTKLKLTHEGLETFPKSNPDLAKENFAQGWTSILDKSLKPFLEKSTAKSVKSK